MKGNDKLLKTLNALLSEELTAINQYMVHSEMCANWGYEKLHKHFEKRAIDEMKHAEKLIGRIIFLEGTPIVCLFVRPENAPALALYDSLGMRRTNAYRSLIFP